MYVGAVVLLVTQVLRHCKPRLRCSALVTQQPISPLCSPPADVPEGGGDPGEAEPAHGHQPPAPDRRPLLRGWGQAAAGATPTWCSDGSARPQPPAAAAAAWSGCTGPPAARHCPAAACCPPCWPHHHLAARCCCCTTHPVRSSPSSPAHPLRQCLPPWPSQSCPLGQGPLPHCLCLSCEVVSSVIVPRGYPGSPCAAAGSTSGRWAPGHIEGLVPLPSIS